MWNVSLHEMPYSGLLTVWEKSADSHLRENNSVQNEESEMETVLFLEHLAKTQTVFPLLFAFWRFIVGTACSVTTSSHIEE